MPELIQEVAFVTGPAPDIHQQFALLCSWTNNLAITVDVKFQCTITNLNAAQAQSLTFKAIHKSAASAKQGERSFTWDKGAAADTISTYYPTFTMEIAAGQIVDFYGYSSAATDTSVAGTVRVLDAMASNHVRTLRSVLAETVTGRLAAAHSAWGDVASPVATAAGINQTGDAYARVGTAGAGLTALGDTRIANLDATVSSRSTFATGGSVVASNMISAATIAAEILVTPANKIATATGGKVTVITNEDKANYALSSANVTIVQTGLATAASQTTNLNAVNAITTNTARSAPRIPSWFEIPAAGSASYLADLYLYSLKGVPEDADAQVTVHARDAAGTSMDSHLTSTSMQRIAAGKYRLTYTVQSTADAQSIYFDFSWAIGGVAMLDGGVTEVSGVNVASTIGAIASNVSTIKGQTDKFTFNGSIVIATLGNEKVQVSGLDAGVIVTGTLGTGVVDLFQNGFATALALSALSTKADGLATALALSALSTKVDGLATTLALSAVSGKVDTIDGIVDTIKLKTDTIVTTPATAAMITSLSAKIDILDAVADAVKLRTDLIPENLIVVSDLTLLAKTTDLAPLAKMTDLTPLVKTTELATLATTDQLSSVIYVPIEALIVTLASYSDIDGMFNSLFYPNSGTHQLKYTVTYEGVPVPGVVVQATYGEDGTGAAGVGVTDENGYVCIPRLMAGPIYLWLTKPDWNFTNPDRENVS